MNFDVAVGGRPWKIAIEPGAEPGQFTVVVKGRKRLVDASWIDADTLSLIAGSASREIRFRRRDDETLEVAVDGRLFEAVVSNKGRSPLVEKAAGPSVGPHSVKAAMPGRIVGVLVTVGERVTAQQPVAIIEAMKMENELRSAVDGTVTQVMVVVGAVVDAGTVLLVIGD